MQPDYICLGNGCFVCERAAIQAMPENANWKKKVQKSIVAYQMQHASDQTLCGGSFNLDSLRRLKPAESEKTKPFYIYDEKLGRKRRHDPWFAKHKVSREEPTTPKRSDPKRKRTKSERDENTQFQCAPFLLDECIKMEPCSNKNFLTPSPISSPTLSARSTTTQPAMIQTQEGLDCLVSNNNMVSNNNNHNNTGDLCINNLMPLLSLNQLDFFPNVNNSNSCENSNSDDNVKIDLDSNVALTGIAHGLDELEWMMGVLAE